LVFVTKYRRGVLTREHLDALRAVFASVCADFGAELAEMDGEDDPCACWSPTRRRSPSAGW
jgi:putative transposase